MVWLHKKLSYFTILLTVPLLTSATISFTVVNENYTPPQFVEDTGGITSEVKENEVILYFEDLYLAHSLSLPPISKSAEQTISQYTEKTLRALGANSKTTIQATIANIDEYGDPAGCDPIQCKIEAVLPIQSLVVKLMKNQCVIETS